MKTSKSPESVEVAPSLKKLKQARLPFKLISEVPSSPVSSQTRKRKLSAPDAVSATKIGKVCKENDSIEDLVVISDEDSKDDQIPAKEDKPLNPFVKLVDAAWKKKLQKSKNSKKNIKKNTITDVINNPVDSESASDTLEDKVVDCEMMEVDIASENDVNIETETDSSNKKVTENQTSFADLKSTESISDIVVLEDSNDSSDKPICGKSNLKPNTEATATGEEDSPVKSNEDQKAEDSLVKEGNIQTNPVTPKRSARNKAKAEQSNNSKSPSSSKLNESANPTTPKQSRSSVASQDESLNDSATSINLTPKQLQKKIESAKKRDEREKEKQERERKKQQEKDEKARQRQEKEDQRKKEREEKEEAKKKEKEEKEEQRKKEREEKERQKDIEKKLREEKEEQKRKEREEKEEQKRKEKEAKEEERRKKQEALELEKQEQELKKKKAAEAFVNFFVPKQKSENDQPTIGPVSKNSLLSSFTIKVDMRLAPTIRVNLSEEKLQDLEKSLQEQNASDSGLYLKCLKEGNKPKSSGKTWPLSDKDDDDVMIVEDELPPIDGAGELISCEPATREKLRPKLLSFHENRRPPYWGTWRKKSPSVKPRRPFGQDEKQVDYEADSDEEWEEEQEGESIDGSAAGSDDEQDADEYEVDNEVFVPHGYLSDEEATMDEDDVLSLSPETQKARLKHLEDEFESEMKKPTEKLKPRLYGLLWETKEGGKPDKCVDAIWNYFGKLAMIINDPTPLLQPTTEPEEIEKKKVKKKKIANEGEQKSPKNDKKKKAKSEVKDGKMDIKKNMQDGKSNQPVINMFLTKFKSI